jgi:8-oxo-dGTP pyrophosphatase MutT (NUDIX family)
MQKSQIVEIVHAYLQRHPSESGRLKDFTDYLTTNDELFSRKNFHGHITTSAIIVDPSHTKVLLIAHKFLNRFLQPGGHFEGDASLALSAAREALEETGVSVQLHPLALADDHPIDIDSHRVPANPKKEEDGHYHFDFRYLFTTTHGDEFAIQEEEVTGCAWYPLESEVVKNCFSAECLAKITQTSGGR